MFLGFTFGGNEDAETLRTTIKAQAKALKTAERVNEDLREQISDHQSETYRGHRIEVKELYNEIEDIKSSHYRNTMEVQRAAEESADERVKSAEKKFEASLTARDATIAELRSEIRDLNLRLEEETLDEDLQVQEGINEYKEGHQSDLTDLQVKCAKLEGMALAATAEGKSKDLVIAALTKMLEARGEDVSEALELVSEVSPSMNVDKFNFEVNVPTQQRGNDQNKQK